MMDMSRRLVLGVAFAGIGASANLGLMAWTLRRCEHELPFLQSEIQHSQQAMLQLEKYYRDGVDPNNTVFEEMWALSVRYQRARDKIDTMQQWMDGYSMMQKLVTWPLLLYATKD
jgi:hypothetical protein